MKLNHNANDWTDEECIIASVHLHGIIGWDACVKISEMAIMKPSHPEVMAVFEGIKLHPSIRVILSKAIEAYRRECKRSRAAN